MIEKVTRFGTDVFADVERDNLRKERCLCLNCKDMSDCETAKDPRRG